MTKDKMKEGFAQRRQLCQEEWSTPAEIAAVDALAKEGYCIVTPWKYSDDFQCERRFAKGTGKQTNAP